MSLTGLVCGYRLNLSPNGHPIGMLRSGLRLRAAAHLDDEDVGAPRRPSDEGTLVLCAKRFVLGVDVCKGAI